MQETQIFWEVPPHLHHQSHQCISRISNAYSNLFLSIPFHSIACIVLLCSYTDARILDYRKNGWSGVAISSDFSRVLYWLCLYNAYIYEYSLTLSTNELRFLHFVPLVFMVFERACSDSVYSYSESGCYFLSLKNKRKPGIQCWWLHTINTKGPESRVCESTITVWCDTMCYLRIDSICAFHICRR